MPTTILFIIFLLQKLEAFESKNDCMRQLHIPFKNYLVFQLQDEILYNNLLFSHSVVSDFLRLYGLQHARLHYLLEFAQTHIHQVGDATQSSHPLSSPSPPEYSLSHHQDLFQ